MSEARLTMIINAPVETVSFIYLNLVIVCRSDCQSTCKQYLLLISYWRHLKNNKKKNNRTSSLASMRLVRHMKRDNWPAHFFCVTPDATYGLRAGVATVVIGARCHKVAARARNPPCAHARHRALIAGHATTAAVAFLRPNLRCMAPGSRATHPPVDRKRRLRKSQSSYCSPVSGSRPVCFRPRPPGSFRAPLPRRRPWLR